MITMPASVRWRAAVSPIPRSGGRRRGRLHVRKVTDLEADEAARGHAINDGDGFVVAPHGSRAGLIWEVGATPYLIERYPMDPTSAPISGQQTLLVPGPLVTGAQPNVRTEPGNVWFTVTGQGSLDTGGTCDFGLGISLANGISDLTGFVKITAGGLQHVVDGHVGTPVPGKSTFNGTALSALGLIRLIGAGDLANTSSNARFWNKDNGAFVGSDRNNNDQQTSIYTVITDLNNVLDYPGIGTAFPGVP